jgi:hypothetical protein
MGKDTKQWVTTSLHYEGQVSVLLQVADAEEIGRVLYFVSVMGCYYHVEYGIVNGWRRGHLKGRENLI